MLTQNLVLLVFWTKIEKRLINRLFNNQITHDSVRLLYITFIIYSSSSTLVTRSEWENVISDGFKETVEILALIFGMIVPRGVATVLVVPTRDMSA